MFTLILNVKQERKKIMIKWEGNVQYCTKSVNENIVNANFPQKTLNDFDSNVVCI